MTVSKFWYIRMSWSESITPKYTPKGKPLYLYPVHTM